MLFILWTYVSCEVGRYGVSGGRVVVTCRHLLLRYTMKSVRILTSVGDRGYGYSDEECRSMSRDNWDSS